MTNIVDDESISTRCIPDLERAKFYDSGSTSYIRTISDHNGIVDDCNSTHDILIAGQTFEGVACNILPYSIIYVTVYSDVASATDGLVIEQGHSENGIETIHWDNSDEFTIPAGKGKTFSIQPALQYIRVSYTNGTSDQTEFRLHVILKKQIGLDSTHRIQDSIIDDDDARLVKSVLTAKNDLGIFTNIRSTNSNNLRVTDAESGLAIAKGDVVNTSFIHKFGRTPSFNIANGFVDIWDGSDSTLPTPAYQYTYSTTANINSISSSSASDTVVIEVQGLDENWNLVTQSVTLSGQTTVNLTTPLIRAFRMKNEGSTSLVGNVYLYINGATVSAGVPTLGTSIRSIIKNGNNQTLMALYTIPAGKTGYMRDWYASTSGARKTSVHVIHLDARKFGKVFQLKHVSSISSSGTSYIQHRYEEPEVFVEKTDLVMHANTDENSASVSAGFDIVLIDN